MTTDANADAPAPAPPPPARRRWLSTIARWTVSFVALGFVLWVVPLRDRCTDAGCEPGLLTTLRGANAPLLAAMFALYLASTLVWAARWRALLGLAHVRPSLREVWRVTLEAQAGGIVLPGGVAGDALRVAYVRERAASASLAKIVASIFADRVTGLVTLSTIAVSAALAFGGAGTLGPAILFLAAVPVAALLGWLFLRMPALARSRFVADGLGAKFVKPVLEYAAAADGPRVVARGLLLSFGVSALQLLVIRGLLAALGGQPASEGWVYVGTTFSMIVAALPATPGGWGTSDAAYVFFLGKAGGVTSSVALSVCLVYRVFWYATGLLGALSALARRTK